VHAHLFVVANVSEGATIADVPALYDPDLASRRADVGSDLLRNQVESALKTRASADFVKDLPYSDFS